MREQYYCWRGGRPAYSTPGLDEKRKRKPNTYRKLKTYWRGQALTKSKRLDGARNGPLMREHRRMRKDKWDELSRAPLGDKAKALANDKKEQERWRSMTEGSGLQIQPASFSRLIK